VGLCIHFLIRFNDISTRITLNSPFYFRHTSQFGIHHHPTRQSSFSCQVLRLCVCLLLRHGFKAVNVSVVGSLAPRATPSLEDQRLHFAWPLTFELSLAPLTLPAAYAPASKALRANVTLRPPLHYKPVVL
jgi:hypothetical protein